MTQNLGGLKCLTPSGLRTAVPNACAFGQACESWLIRYLSTGSPCSFECGDFYCATGRADTAVAVAGIMRNFAAVGKARGRFRASEFGYNRALPKKLRAGNHG